MATRRELLRGLLGMPVVLGVQPSHARTIAITEAEFTTLFCATWAMGYAVIPTLPFEPEVVRRSCAEITETVLAICDREKPDMLALMKRHR